MSKPIQAKCSEGPIEMEVYSMSSPKTLIPTLRSFSTTNPYEKYITELSSDDTKIRTNSECLDKDEDPPNIEPINQKNHINRHSNTILTSKNDVFQYLNKKSTREFTRFGDTNDISCRHCLLQ
ncbi:hypothetical protein SteCoe_9049 [Stentor coeruleus]|uniref:Uncharacterized protein n=1 Tax=Stentor coeruleus TaxID=5963 RepID=A0A1R2CJ07_9CILI|nr:hypothetical protein SteCoe_9049 [Stentor coeruleus]